MNSADCGRKITFSRMLRCRRLALHPRPEALSELGQLGRNDGDAVGGALALARPIILMIILGREPVTFRLDGRHHLAVMLLVGARNRGHGRLALPLILREDSGAILGADIIALAV